MKLKQFESESQEACQNLPTKVQAAIKTLIDHAKTRKTEVITDHVDSFLPIGGDGDSIELSLCLRLY